MAAPARETPIASVLCNGARGARGASAEPLVLRLSPPRANLALSIAGLGPSVAARIPAAFLDLIELAVYVETADLVTPERPARAPRRFHLRWPVRAPEVFRDPSVFVPLQTALAVLSGDEWRLDAQPRRTARDRWPDALLDGDGALAELRGAVDVVPFSGGLDSFAGALRLIREGRKVVLLAHRSAAKIERHVVELAEALIGEGAVGFVPSYLRRDLRVREGVAHTRGLLWTALAGAVAAAHGKGSSVRFFENGVVALGLPLSVAGASAPARAADPRVLAAFTKALSALAGRRLLVDDRFLLTTKAEVVRGLVADGGAAWLQRTVSCAGRAPRGHTHCGLCAQCLDRRFATLAAGVEAHDPSALYAVDLLTGARPAGTPRAVLEAYLASATAVSTASDAEVLARHPELSRVLPLLPGSTHDAATALVDLQRRHAREVEEVLDAGIREHATALRRDAIPKSALLRLALPHPPEPQGQPPSDRTRASAPSGVGAAAPSGVGAAAPPGVGASAPPGVVRVLHVSDLHFSKRRGWDQDPVLASLAEDVARLRAAGLPPDFVAVTGDVADRAAPEEYALAARFFRERLLPAAGVPIDRLLMVPGNHDVDRGAVKLVAQSVQSRLLSSESQDVVAAIVGDPAEHAPLLRRHDAWRAFVKELGVPRSDDVPWWSRTFEVSELRVHVAGLCSSWLAWCDEDKGRLVVGRAQLHAVLEGARVGADLALALVHHPWDYLADFDAAEVREAVHRRTDVLLRGHLHKGEGAARVRPDGGSLELAAGASWGGSQHLHGYQLVELEPQAGQVRVHLRTWDGHDWIADRNSYRGAAAGGVATFPLDIHPERHRGRQQGRAAARR